MGRPLLLVVGGKEECARAGFHVVDADHARGIERSLASRSVRELQHPASALDRRVVGIDDDDLSIHVGRAGAGSIGGCGSSGSASARSARSIGGSTDVGSTTGDLAPIETVRARR